MTTTMDTSKKGSLWEQLNTVLDPEVGYGIVDLGLIYDVRVERGVAHVTMTLTSPMCPAGPEIMEGIQSALRRLEGISDVMIDLVWEPAWGVERVNKDLRGMLFGSDA